MSIFIFIFVPVTLLLILCILPIARVLLSHTVEMIGKPPFHDLRISLWLLLPILDNSIATALLSLTSRSFLASPLLQAGCREGVHIDQRYARNKNQKKNQTCNELQIDNEKREIKYKTGIYIAK